MVFVGLELVKIDWNFSNLNSYSNWCRLVLIVDSNFRFITMFPIIR